MTRASWLLTGFLIAFSLTSPIALAQLPGQSPEQANYISPYQFAASVTDPTLTSDFREEPKLLSNWRNWSETPYRDWHNFRVIERLHSTWGPYYIKFRGPAGVLDRPADWLQKRIIAAASLMRNTAPYGHHHMAQWSVPDEPRWTDHRYEPGYGFDCSDFTHFAYSYGLGIELKTGIREQADLTRAPIHFADGATGEVRARRLFDVQNGYTKTYADLVKQLHPGDLLYIRSNAALTHPISHVIMWMGNLAHDTTDQDKYLVMDSHGAVVKDSRGVTIPSGPELRPFREDSYYFRSFDHIVRYVPLERE